MRVAVWAKQLGCEFGNTVVSSQSPVVSCQISGPAKHGGCDEHCANRRLTYNSVWLLAIDHLCIERTPSSVGATPAPFGIRLDSKAGHAEAQEAAMVIRSAP